VRCKTPKQGIEGTAEDGDTWVEGLADALGGKDRLDDARALARRIPLDYREHSSPLEAALDATVLRELYRSEAGGEGDGTAHRFVVRAGPGADPTTFRLRRFSLQRGELSRVFPLIESFGLSVVEILPYLIEPAAAGEPPAYIEDFVLRLTTYSGRTMEFDPGGDGPRLVEALQAVERRDGECDRLNRLVIAAGLDWRQVSVLRGYGRYLHQLGLYSSETSLEAALTAFPDVAQRLVGYFAERFDPGRRDEDAALVRRTRVTEALAAIPDLEHDRLLRSFLEAIDVTERTNYFQVGADGRPSSTLVLKLGRGDGAELSGDRFWIESFVFGPLVEGLHLRAGLLARGGIRWSTRHADLRTEVSDLARAQVMKNAIIVPTGAKGGFLCRGTAGIDPGPADVEEAYRAFIGGLLDVTDNVVGGETRTPPGVLAFDGEDPYLVVAPDKGTAALSDVANALSLERGFWLGDAFASGGSHGFDHKAMGITARGAWRAARSHFRQLGVDVQQDPVSVVGIGDMSGDVFGNGMLQSRAVRLVGAFDHRHIFLDPEPDPALSFEERRRLYLLPHSSWDDYDRSLISAGGGVWPRSVKRIALSPEARQLLRINEEALQPPELIVALLSAPVDLLWIGGIGTYIKGPLEANEAVGDHVNDPVRITADHVRARVVVEGANLGITQSARIFYSRRGGRINTDFIDNAAGVVTSDREVNVKILLSMAMAEGSLDMPGRDEVLVGAQEEIAEQVLRQVDRSVAALTRAVPASADQFDDYRALLELLSEQGPLDRKGEKLPDAEEMALRRTNGAGMLRPELAVLLAYAKSNLAHQIDSSAMVSGPVAVAIAASYFPHSIRERFGHLVARHRLFPQLVACTVANEIVDQMGAVWAFETAQELGRETADVATTFWAARQVLGADQQWRELELHSAEMSADAETELHHTVTQAVGALARTYLKEPGPIVADRLIDRDAPLARQVLTTNPTAADFVDAGARDGLISLGIDGDVAARFVLHAALARLGDAGQVARRTGCTVGEALTALAVIGRVVGLDGLSARIDAVGRADRWRGWQARALLDEVAEWRAATALSVLSGGNGQVAETLGKWEHSILGSLDRSNRLLAELQEPGADALTLGALMLRALRARTES
jgi:glutamate dehydrogenase